MDPLFKKGNILVNCKKTSEIYMKFFQRGHKTYKQSSEGNLRLIDTITGKSAIPMPVYLPRNVNIDNLMFTSPNKSIAAGYMWGGGHMENKVGALLEFEVPVSYINKYARDATGRLLKDPPTLPGTTLDGTWGSKAMNDVMDQVYPSLIFTEGLPTDFLKKVSTGFMP